MQMLFRGSAVDVLYPSGSLTKVRPTGGDEWSTFYAKTADLKPLKVKTLTDVQTLQQCDPTALTDSKKYGPNIYIYCQPSVVEQESRRSGIAAHFIKPTSELSHGAKYDILFTYPVPPELMNRLSAHIADVDIVHNRICSRNLSLWLVGEGVIPEVPSESDVVALS